MMYELMNVRAGQFQERDGFWYEIGTPGQDIIKGWREGERQQVIQYLTKNIKRMNINFSGQATWNIRATRGTLKEN